ncbi:Translation initiation factor [Giardia lamblia P15]|uniref:Translation initiation factor eIF2B subunit beta n=1 Tax=Giardia intestinalis (strain P15) TaxID=658858 RepID=E1EW12_GIAIA|nr:Translation initiation factor [Giardia lamblia P15]
MGSREFSTNDLDVLKQIKGAKEDKFQVVLLIIRYVIELVKKLEFSSAEDIVSKMDNRIARLQSFLPLNLLITNVGKRCIACVVEVLHESGVIQSTIPLFEQRRSPDDFTMSPRLQSCMIDRLHSYEEHICSIRLKPCDLNPRAYNTGASMGYCSPSELMGSLTTRASVKPTMRGAVNSSVDEYRGIRNKFSQAVTHGDIVLVVSPGIQLCNYLTELYAGGVGFELVVLENEPLRDGLHAALYFSSFGIPTSLIADSALMIFLPKIAVLFLEPEFVFNNGAAVASSGSVLAAMAAKIYNIPVNCLCETFQFCTAYPSSPSTLILSANPSEILPDADSYDTFKKVTIKAPLAGYIEPDCIDYYITSEGIFKPKAIFQLLQAIMNI